MIDEEYCVIKENQKTGNRTYVVIMYPLKDIL